MEILRQSSHPKAKTANPDDFVDMSLVKKLEDGGFFGEPDNVSRCGARKRAKP